MGFWVYILQCSDDSYYTGHTDDLQKRINQHQSGEIGGFTAKRRPINLVWSQEFTSRYEALSAEMQIKKWSRAKKEALIKENWFELSRLSKRRTPSKK